MAEEAVLVSALLYLVFCGLIGYWASCRGRSAVLWGILALLFSPLLSGIVLALLKDQSVQASISDLQMGQQQLHDRVATNEKMTAQHFQQMQQQISQQGAQQAYLQQQQQAPQQTLSAGSSQPRFCANCGTPLAPGEKFCPKCGTKAEG